MRATKWRETTSMISMRALLLNVLVLMLLVGAARAEISRTSGLIAEGTKWENPFYIVDSGVEGPALLITGGLHGNEPAGYRAAEQIRHWPIRRGKLIVVPRVNTPGLKQNTRWLPGESKELRNANRNFPKSGEPNEARSVPIKALWKFMQAQQPDWVVDMHEGYDFNIANSKSDGSSIIYFDTPEMQQLAAKMHDAVNATIDDPKRKIVKRSKSGPVNGGLVRAAVKQLGASGFCLETTYQKQPVSTRTRQHRIMVHCLMRELGMVGNDGIHVMTSPDEESIQVAIYDAGGTGGSGVQNIGRILESVPRFVIHHVGPADIQTGVLDQFDAVIFPGGSGSKEAAAIGVDGCTAVREFVKDGGGYVGICAGAFLATAKYDWSLALMNARTFTGKREIPGVGAKSMWYRGKGRVKMELTDEGRKILGDMSGLLDVGYANGPILSPAGREDVPDYVPLALFRTEIGLWEPQKGTMIDTPAIAASKFGKGRAIAISPHPEGTPGLEPLVQRAVAWVAGREEEIGACRDSKDKGCLDQYGQWIETQEQKHRRMAWWRQARFGMFIHWGLYSVTAGRWEGEWQKNKYSEWIMIHFHIPVEEYRKLAGQFNPTEFDAEQWVTLAKYAGMKYIVFVAKHHDGFAMYDSDASDYNIVDATPFKRDPFKELAEACKKHDMKLCFYYSQSQDWNEPDGLCNYWDFPDDVEDKSVKSNRNWVRTTFPDYMRRKGIPQVKELLTKYGPIGLVWYDTPRTLTEDQAVEFINVVRKLQPDAIVNSRIHRSNKHGDYGSTGDNRIPGTGRVGDWEMPGTINDTWGWRSDDHEWKSSETLIHNLVNIASMGGNYLLNVGPKATGEIPIESVDRLKAMGDWMKVNGESICGTHNSPFKRSAIKWGRCTAKDDRLYFHVFDWPEHGKLTVPTIRNEITRTYLLANGENLNTTKSNDGIAVEVPEEPLDDVATVIVLEFKGKLDL